MTAQDVFSTALNLAFLAIFAVTLRDYLRRRDRVSLAVMSVFASLAIVLVASALRGVVSALAGPLGLISLPALVAEPLLTVWLVHQFRPLGRPLRIAAGVAFAILICLFVGLVAGGPTAAWLNVVFIVGFVVYFIALELGAAAGFALEARRRAGTSRFRLVMAAVATGLFGVVIGILVVGGASRVAGDGQGAVIAIVDGLSLLAAVGYLMAFAPPRSIRRLAQQTIAFDFIRELNAMPAGAPVDDIWSLLARTAVRASGARRAVVELGSPERDHAALELRRTEGLVEVPLHSDRWPRARLELEMAVQPLFVGDDLELIRLLADRAVQAAENGELTRDRERLILDLRAASAAKSDFLASMSHELRTPLNAIIGFSELLLAPDAPTDAPTVTTFAGHIHDSGLHLLDLINEVLDLARVEAGRLELKPVAVDLADVVRQTAETMRPLADRKQITLAVDGAQSVPVVADPARLRQIVFNLLSNALKFTPDGGAVRAAVEARDGETVLTVIDTGPGIAEADQARIFEAFEQVGASGGPGRSGGTGLGLALTRRLVEAHGGAIDVVSRLGEGSTFTARLPRGQAGGPPLAGVLPADAPGNLPVLVIEDDPAAAELLRVYLEGAGYTVAVTPNGLDGVAWAAEHRPGAIVLDILLPDIDGWEVLQRLKRDAATQPIPVLVVSVVDDRPLGLALGAVDYFVKPISREPLLAAIGRLTFTTKVKTRTVTVLVIDADPDAAPRYREVLEPEGFRVLAAADRAVGTALARESKPDLVLIDALLADGSGFDVVASLKDDPATSDIPIWVTTPGELAAVDKERLTGKVLGVAERGDAALTALRQWLSPLTPQRSGR